VFDYCIAACAISATFQVGMTAALYKPISHATMKINFATINRRAKSAGYLVRKVLVSIFLARIGSNLTKNKKNR
jgi:hypothetical protein